MTPEVARRADCGCGCGNIHNYEHQGGTKVIPDETLEEAEQATKVTMGPNGVAVRNS